MNGWLFFHQIHLTKSDVIRVQLRFDSFNLIEVRKSSKGFRSMVKSYDRSTEFSTPS